MKKPLFLTVYFLIFSVSSFCQNWAPIGAEWHYNSVNQDDGILHPHSEYIHYKVTKDTIYQGLSCRKIEGKYYRYKNAEIKDLTPEFTYNNADTVFYYYRKLNKFVPIYIFNVKSGDTIKIYSNFLSDSAVSFVVDSIVTHNFNSEAVKMIHFSRERRDSFSMRPRGSYYENIGSTKTFFVPVDFVTVPEVILFIRCYKDDKISIKFTDVECDFRQTSGIDEINEKQKLSFFPNPVSDKLTFINIAGKYNNFQIYNQLGQKVKIDSFSPDKNEINIQNLPKGIYFMNFSSNAQNHTFKFIKN